MISRAFGRKSDYDCEMGKKVGFTFSQASSASFRLVKGPSKCFGFGLPGGTLSFFKASSFDEAVKYAGRVPRGNKAYHHIIISSAREKMELKTFYHKYDKV